MREATIRGAARTYYDLMSADERIEIDRAVARLERDASPDGQKAFAMPDIPGLLTYDDGTWQMVYASPDTATLVIRSIAHTLDLPR